MCKEWDQLIKTEVWGSEEGRRVMERRLEIQWRHAQPTRKEVEVPGYNVVDVTCDETHIAHWDSIGTFRDSPTDLCIARTLLIIPRTVLNLVMGRKNLE